MLLIGIVFMSAAGCSTEQQSGEPVPSDIDISTEKSGDPDGKKESEALDTQDEPERSESKGVPEESGKMVITAGSYRFTVTLENNSSGEALREFLAGGPVTLSLEDYAGMEKVGDLGTTLPRNDKQIATTKGDVILYLGNQFAIYYGDNSWNLTRLGRIDDVQHLEEALGRGSILVTLSLK